VANVGDLFAQRRPAGLAERILDEVVGQHGQAKRESQNGDGEVDAGVHQCADDDDDRPVHQVERIRDVTDVGADRVAQEVLITGLAPDSGSDDESGTGHREKRPRRGEPCRAFADQR
jgi:hypothetical protein